MHGYFAGTDAKFAFYFPPPEQYEGRLILGPTHQLTNNENGRDPTFAFASGAYLVATNLGGSETPLLPLPVGAADTSIRGYRRPRRSRKPRASGSPRAAGGTGRI